MARGDQRMPGCYSIEDAIRLLELDDHPFSPRPCSTCSAISWWAKLPVGCVAVSMRETRAYAGTFRAAVGR